MAALQQAFQFDRKELLQLHASDVYRAGACIRVWMDEAPGLDRKIESIEGRDVQSHADRDRLGITDQVFEIHSGLIQPLLPVGPWLFFSASPLRDELDSGRNLNGPANVVQLVHKLRGGDFPTRRKVKVVRESSGWEISLPKGVATFQY